jgi:hypothetical protein
MKNQKKKMEDIISILGTIQMRDKAKNVLKEYYNLLDDDEKKIIQKDKRKISKERGAPNSVK